MTYNEKFGGVFDWGSFPMAEYFVPSEDGSGATLLLCAQHARRNSNFSKAKKIEVFCDTICDDCADKWFQGNREGFLQKSYQG